MKTNFVICFAALAVLGTGCIVENATPYEPCGSNRDCVGFDSDTCAGVIQNWGGGDVVEDGICTTYDCSSDFDCARSHNGSLGFCSPYAILGTNPYVCFERCYYDGDCATGFTCANSKEVYGLVAGEQICVPAPRGVYVPPAQDPYSTCTYDTDCTGNGGLTDYCVTYDPKMAGQTGSFPVDICTVECTFDTDCPDSSNGYTGFCAPYNSVADGQVCIERCDYDVDCDGGFICVQMRTIPSLGIDSDEGICAPDPNF